MLRSLVGSEMCIRDRVTTTKTTTLTTTTPTTTPTTSPITTTVTTPTTTTQLTTKDSADSTTTTTTTTPTTIIINSKNPQTTTKMSSVAVTTISNKTDLAGQNNNRGSVKGSETNEILLYVLIIMWVLNVAVLIGVLRVWCYRKKQKRLVIIISTKYHPS